MKEIELPPIPEKVDLGSGVSTRLVPWQFLVDRASLQAPSDSTGRDVPVPVGGEDPKHLETRMPKKV